MRKSPKSCRHTLPGGEVGTGSRSYRHMRPGEDCNWTRSRSCRQLPQGPDPTWGCHWVPKLGSRNQRRCPVYGPWGLHRKCKSRCGDEYGGRTRRGGGNESRSRYITSEMNHCKGQLKMKRSMSVVALSMNPRGGVDKVEVSIKEQIPGVDQRVKTRLSSRTVGWKRAESVK